MLQHEQFLYDFIKLEDYPKYCLEIQNRFPKSKSSIYVNMCAGDFTLEKRVMWHLLFLRERKSVKEESIVFTDPSFRFQYGCYFEFFNYLQNMYQVFMIENPNFTPYFCKSLISLCYIYPYLEQGYLLGNEKYQYFCKQDFESVLGVDNFSFLKDQLYLNSIATFIREFKDVQSTVFQNTLNGNLTRAIMTIYFYSMLYMIDERNSIYTLYNQLYILMNSFSKEAKQFLEKMLDNGHQLYLKRNLFLKVQEEYLKK